MTFFELYRRDSTRRVVAALGVVKHLDVAENIGAGILSGGVNLAANPLALEQLEEAFGHSVVLTVAPTAHAADQVVVSQEPLPVMACELTALVGMHQHRGYPPKKSIGMRSRFKQP